MAKRIILGTLAVFITWSVCDYLIHGILLAQTYSDTAQLWRPMAEMKMGLMRVVTLLSALAFTALYVRLVTPKHTKAALHYGFLFGFVGGLNMGYGTFAVMPIPYLLALSWFLTVLIECILGAYVMSLVVRE